MMPLVSWQHTTCQLNDKIGTAFLVKGFFNCLFVNWLYCGLLYFVGKFCPVGQRTYSDADESVADPNDGVFWQNYVNDTSVWFGVTIHVKQATEARSPKNRRPNKKPEIKPTAEDLDRELEAYMKRPVSA
uniref:FoP_duplication domain-containing protein n=1 Tax=Panagrellus redivivus TaxID=6233 RepID=A0A7E4W6P5_PANRE